jgi:diguanylate cyclase (GGDEF)-like protein/PAS domain S-box-containing protein
MFGYSNKEFYDKPTFIKEIIHSDWVSYFQSEWTKLLDGEAPDHYEYPVTHKNGNTVWIYQYNMVEYDESGKPKGIYGLLTDVSQYKETEMNLDQSRKRFSEIALATSDWVWEVDAQGVYTYVSDRVEEFLGYKASEVIGKTPFDTMPQDEVEKIAEAFGAIVSKQEPFKDLENRNIHKDGHEVVLQTSGFPIFDHKGDFIGYRGADRDITEIKHLINSLQSNQSLLKEAQRIANIGHWELDLVNNVLSWSDEVYRIFGLQPQEFGATYEAFLEHIHPDDRDMVNEAYSDSLESKSSYNIIHRVITKQKELKYVEERCEHTLNSNQEVEKSIGTVLDITEKVLKDKEIYLHSQVFNYSTDSIIITDQDNKIISCNNGFTDLTGFTQEDAVGQNPRLLSSGWGDKEFYQKMWSDITQKGIWQGEIWDRKKDGELYIAKQTIVCVKNKKGEIENFIAVGHDITDQKEHEKEITKLSNYDFLTKLPNRKLFKEEVSSYIKSSHYNDSTFAILFLDLDNFKWVNDTLGHKVGDDVLVYAANEISKLIDEDTILARLGGDEFILLQPYHDLLEVSILAKSIITRFEETFEVKGHSINVGWSIGVALFPENGESFDDLLKNSDIAMYQAKSSGKNNVQFFTNSMNEEAQQKLLLDTRLKEAIKKESFYLVYQPKVTCKTKEVVGAEALIRWEDEELGFVPPDQFIMLAEENGLILNIGSWVVEEAFKDIKKLVELGFRDQKVAINLSVQQLEQTTFIEEIKKLLSKYSLESKNIEFEVTESALMSNIEDVSEAIKALKEMGITIAIDDFGTGYSSLSYLNKLPFDTLKIDREFVWDLKEDGNIITEAILALSKTMNFKTVAEGVETKEQAKILNSYGCTLSQGYLFSKPIVFEEYVNFIKENDLKERSNV